MEHTSAPKPMTRGSSGGGRDGEGAIDHADPLPSTTSDEHPACDLDEESICPLCAGTMRLWAAFYRCPNCGYKASCCF